MSEQDASVDAMAQRFKDRQHVSRFVSAWGEYSLAMRGIEQRPRWEGVGEEGWSGWVPNAGSVPSNVVSESPVHACLCRTRH